VYKICKNYFFEKQSGGDAARVLEPCTWCRHPRWAPAEQLQSIL